MASNYVCDHSSQHNEQNGSFTIIYLRRTPAQPSSHVPSWENFMRDDVLHMTSKLLKMGKQNPDADLTLTADSGLDNGLSIELQITGIEVSEDSKKSYLHRMKQYLKKMSKTVHVVVQTARAVRSRVQRQERSQVSEIQNETPSRGICCKAEPCLEYLFGSVAIVPDYVPLRQDNSILELCEGDRRIPSAFLPNTFIPLNCVTPTISVFVPQCSFQAYVIPWNCLPTNEVYLMVATPYLLGFVTGLLPFLRDSNVENVLPTFERVRINPPFVNLKAPLVPPMPRVNLRPPLVPPRPLAPPRLVNLKASLAPPRIVNLRAPFALPRPLVNVRVPFTPPRPLVNLRAPRATSLFQAPRGRSWEANDSDFPTL